MKENILDQKDKIFKNDPSNMLSCIEDLPEQIKETWEQVKKMIIPAHYINIDNVIIAGMGGSAIGPDSIVNFAKDTLKKPIEIVRDYNLPKYLSKKTLVIISSYSGTTEETLSAFEQAINADAKIIGIAHQGTVEQICANNKIPFFRIDYDSQPRAASPSSAIAIAGMLNKLDIIKITDEEIENTYQETKELQASLNINISSRENQAKILALKIHEYIPFIIASGSLVKAAHKFKISFNENSKHLAFYEAIPELNHNTMTGLEFPYELNKKVFIIILQSIFDHPRNKLRSRIILNLLSKRKIKFDTVMFAKSSCRLAEMFKMIELGDYVSYYLATLNGIDPTPVKAVDYFKNELNKENKL